MVKVATAETTAQKTLSSIELAEISGRRHDSIMRSVERMNKDLIAMSKPPAVASQYKDSTGRILPSYNLTKYQCELLAMALSGEARIRVLDRLYELEKENQSFTPIVTNTRLMQDGYALPNVPLNYDDIGQFGLAVWQGLSQIQGMLERQGEELEMAKSLLTEQHELINTLTQENAQTVIENNELKKENNELKSNPLAMLTTSLRLATGREVNLSLGPTIGNINYTHTTIKGFCAEHKIKLGHGDSIRFSNILKSLCKKAGEKITKIPDEQYGSLNIYPRYLLANAVKSL